MADRYRDKPFSADDDYGRDQYGRDDHGTAKRPADSDPLAELARLIGQADPFSTFGRDNQPAAPSRDQFGARDPDPAYDEDPANTPSWMRNRAPAQDQPQGGNDPYDQRYADDPYRAPQQGHEAPRFDPVSADPRQSRGTDPTRYDDVLFGQPDHDPHRDTRYPAQHDGYGDDAYGRPEYDDGFDEQAPKSRRGGTMTVVIVLLLAVVGTAAAFTYRTFIGSPRSGEPPVIKADAGPNKVVPAGSGKQIVDRVGEKGAERVVSREEQPLDVNGKPQPRVVFPPLTQNTNPPTVTSANTGTRPTGAGVGNGTLGGDEPRKIRTLAIRPDQSDAVAAPTAAAAPPRAAQASAARAPVPASTASTAPASANGPIALTPQGQTAVTETRPRVASISPPIAGGSGSYVQVSSQKTEADAQASFKAIQSKYAEVLGSRASTIRRADLGDKGVFYRALVGPFGTTDEATQFCVNLKAAGGQCIVQR